MTYMHRQMQVENVNLNGCIPQKLSLCDLQDRWTVHHVNVKAMTMMKQLHHTELKDAV